MNLNRIFTMLILFFAQVAIANETAESRYEEPPKTKKDSPWLATPLVSSDPKLGTSVGALGAYMHHFDKLSPVSMFGIAGIYSHTDSYFANMFANMYFDKDQQRLLTFIGYGNVKNEYSYKRDDDQDSVNLKTTDDITLAFLRYSHRLYGDWFIGGQLLHTNYILAGSDPFSQGVLDLIDLVGFKSNAIGLVATYDSRDNQQSASSGQNFVFHQFAFRESLGGDETFDAYQADYSTYLAHGKGHVFGIHAKGRWTKAAPNGGYSSIELRGYIRGQYLAEHSTLVEVEERFKIAQRWGVSVFAGVGCLYGDNLAGEKKKCSESENLFPAAGGGVNYMIKPEEKMVVRAEIAVGKRDNQGFYLKFGQPF